MNIGFIGCGRMGGALVKSLIQNGFSAKRVSCFDHSAENLAKMEAYGVKIAESGKEVAKNSTAIFLCVKPKDVQKTLAEIRGALNEQVIISIAAGKKLSFYREMLDGRKIVRLMPNIAALAGESMNAFACINLAPGEKDEIALLLKLCGQAIELDEGDFDAATAISGCGPAFVALFAQALIRAGKNNGLEPKVARALAVQTILGTARLLDGCKLEPEAIVEMVSSPAGATMAGRKILEEGRFSQIIEEAVGAARKRSEEMGKDG